jgi:hypothetical protein
MCLFVNEIIRMGVADRILLRISWVFGTYVLQQPPKLASKGPFTLSVRDSKVESPTIMLAI